MYYEPTKWQDHVTEYPGEYRIEKTSRGTYTIVPAGKVIQEGTPQNAENFNKVENAIIELFLKLGVLSSRDIPITDSDEYFDADNVEDVLQEIGEKGSKVTLTMEQIDALDKLFEKAAYTDETISTAYHNFITAFGLDQYRAMRVLGSSDILPCGVSNYYDINLHTSQWIQYNGIPYTRTVNDSVENATVIDRSCYPYFDIPAEGGYSYQIYFEATNADVQVSLEFYNETTLAAIAAGENYSESDKKDGYGWQNSMGYEWTPPTEHNGSPIKAMRLNFNSEDAGVQKVIIYRKKVV